MSSLHDNYCPFISIKIQRLSESNLGLTGADDLPPPPQGSVNTVQPPDNGFMVPNTNNPGTTANPQYTQAPTIGTAAQGMAHFNYSKEPLCVTFDKDIDNNCTGQIML